MLIKLKRLTIFTSIIALLISCSAGTLVRPQIQRSGQYRVEVTSNGQKVDKSNIQLVERKYFESKKVEALLDKLEDPATILYSFADFNVRGEKQRGIRVRKVSPAVYQLGLLLRQGDTLISIGLKNAELIPKYEVMSYIFKELLLNKKVTMSVLRDGKYRKFIYLLNN